MTQLERVKKVQDLIINNLQPGKYKKLDDIKIELLNPKHFDKAWRELIIIGRVESCGNEIRLNQ